MKQLKRNDVRNKQETSRTSARSAYCKSGKASWRWRNLSCVWSEEGDLDEAGIPDVEVESNGRVVSPVTGLCRGRSGRKTGEAGWPHYRGF